MKTPARLRSFLVIASSSLLLIPNGHAAVGTWADDTGNYDWSDATRWSTNPTVPGTTAGDIINFTNDISSARQITVDTNRTMGSLNIGDSDYTHAFTLATSGAGTLTFDNSGAAAMLTETGSIPDMISVPLILNGNLTASIAGELTLSGGISEPGGKRVITKSGAGTLILSNANTYSGGTTIKAGTLRLDHAAALNAGDGTITFSGGTLQYGTSITTDYSGRLATGVGNHFRIDTNGNNVTFGSQIIGTANASTFTKLGAGILTLNSPVSRYTGATTIAGGTLNAAKIANANTDSSIGKPATNAAESLVIAGGTLQHDAANVASTDRLFSIGGATGDTATLDSSAAITTNTMSFTNTGSIAFGNTNAHSLTLTGSNMGDNTFAPTIGDSTGATSLIKDGAGKWTLTSASTYSGATTVTAGKLSIGPTGTIQNTSAVTIGAGEFSYNNSTTALSQTITFSGSTGTLSGTGIISPATVVTSGNRQTAGTSVTATTPSVTLGKQTFGTSIDFQTGSIFEWNLTANADTSVGTRGTNYDAVDTTSLLNTGAEAIFRVVLNGTENFDEAFWNADRSWTDIFKNGSAALNIEEIFGTGANVEYYYAAGQVANGNTTGRRFSISGTTLRWTAVPEPTSALVGLLVTAGLLRRRRVARNFEF